MTLKNHFGFYVLLAMTFTLFWAVSERNREEFPWYVGPGAAFLIASIVEVFGWTYYYFFRA